MHKTLGRLDYQFTPQTRLSARVSYFNNEFYAGGGATSHPSAGGTRKRTTSAVHRHVHAGAQQPVGERNPRRRHQLRAAGPARRPMEGRTNFRITLSGSGNASGHQPGGYTIGANTLNIFQHTQTVRDDYTTSYDWGGRHDVKLGGEYFRFQNDFRWCNRCMGDIDARQGAVPGNLEALFPVWNDASTWNLQPLSPITRQVFHAISDTDHRYNIVRHVLGGWMQDDWRIGNSLTLNLGVRYDWDSNGHSEKLEFRPFLPGDLPRDTNNVAPRVGMNLRLNEQHGPARRIRALLRVRAERRRAAELFDGAPVRIPDRQQRSTRLRAELVRPRAER